MATNLGELWKKGTAAPLPADLVQGGIGIDIASRKVYSKADDDTIFQVGNDKLDNINPVMNGSMTEQVTTMTDVVLEPDNGTVQTNTLDADTTFTDGLESGQSMTLVLIGGASYGLTFPIITWVGGSVPLFTATDTLVFFKVHTELFGVYIGTNVQG